MGQKRFLGETSAQTDECHGPGPTWLDGPLPRPRQCGAGSLSSSELPLILTFYGLAALADLATTALIAGHVGQAVLGERSPLGSMVLAHGGIGPLIVFLASADVLIGVAVGEAWIQLGKRTGLWAWRLQAFVDGVVVGYGIWLAAAAISNLKLGVTLLRTAAS